MRDPDRSMNRRDFLKLIGVAGTAATLAPARIVVASPAQPRVRLSRHAFLMPDTLRIPTGLQVAGYILRAPAKTLCRARFQPFPDDFEEGDVMCALRGVCSGNTPGQVALEHVSMLPDRRNLLYSEADAAVFAMTDCFCPVDWGIPSNKRPLELDFRAIGDNDEEFFLAFTYQIIPNHAGFSPHLVFGDR